MAEKTLFEALVFLSVFFLHKTGGLNIIPDFYMQGTGADSCDQVIVDTPNAYILSHIGAYLLSTPSLFGYRTNVDCAVTFQTEPGTRIKVSPLGFRLPGNSTQCQDKLDIYDTDDVIGYPTLTACGRKTWSAFESSSNNITLIFTSDSTSSEDDKGFMLLVMSFSDANNQTCTGSDFQCDTDRCISKSFLCDGVNHCEDGTDEDQEDQTGCTVRDAAVGFEFSLGSHAVLAICILLGATIFIIITAVVIYNVCYKRKPRRVGPSHVDPENDDEDKCSVTSSDQVLSGTTESIKPNKGGTPDSSHTPGGSIAVSGEDNKTHTQSSSGGRKGTNRGAPKADDAVQFLRSTTNTKTKTNGLVLVSKASQARQQEKEKIEKEDEDLLDFDW